MYSDEELLPLSGLQHLAFCERQWALIHIEQLWSENLHTAGGRVLHDRVHGDAEASELRGDLLITRGVPLVSYALGIRGVADVVEFERLPGEDADGAVLPKRKGRWRPFPVEYKRGKPKEHDADLVQVCAQALCLEEMLGVPVRNGALYYGQPRRRHLVTLHEGLRERVNRLAGHMHELFRLGRTPAPSPGPQCDSCSLVHLCLPRAARAERSARGYLKRMIAKTDSAEDAAQEPRETWNA